LRRLSSALLCPKAVAVKERNKTSISHLIAQMYLKLPFH